MTLSEPQLTSRLQEAVPTPPNAATWGRIARARAARTTRVRIGVVGVGVCLALAGVMVVPALLR